MPFDANGNYTLPTIYIAIPGEVIKSTQHNTPFEDVQAALNNTLCRDGRTPWTGNQNANNNKLTGLANGTEDTDAVTFAQLGDYAKKTDLENADAALQSQLDYKISTTLGDDGINSAVTIMSLLDADNTIWVGTTKGGSMALVKSQPGSGFYKILNLSTDKNGSLVVPDSSGSTWTYAHSASGEIAASGNVQGGYWVRTGNILRQVFTCNAKFGDFITFPTSYAKPPVIHVTAYAYEGQATTANILGSPGYNGFTFVSSFYAGNPNQLENAGTNTISVTVEGLVNS